MPNLSNCCKKEITGSNNPGMTHWFVCTGCNNPCDYTEEKQDTKCSAKDCNNECYKGMTFEWDGKDYCSAECRTKEQKCACVRAYKPMPEHYEHGVNICQFKPKPPIQESLSEGWEKEYQKFTSKQVNLSPREINLFKSFIRNLLKEQQEEHESLTNQYLAINNHIHKEEMERQREDFRKDLENFDVDNMPTSISNLLDKYNTPSQEGIK